MQFETFFYLRTNVTLTSSCCKCGDHECRFLRTMRYVTYTHFVWDLFCHAKTIFLHKNWLKQNTYKIGKSWRCGIFTLPRSIIPYQQSSNVSSHKLSCKTIWTFWTKGKGKWTNLEKNDAWIWFSYLLKLSIRLYLHFRHFNWNVPFWKKLQLCYR